MFSSNEDLTQNLTSKKYEKMKIVSSNFSVTLVAVVVVSSADDGPKNINTPISSLFKTLHNEIWSRSRSERNYFQTSKKFFWALKKKKKLWNIDRWFLLKAPPLTIFVRPFVLVFEKDYLGKIMKNILAQK